jgi:alpha-tubulin N-acetyltransferase 1
MGRAIFDEMLHREGDVHPAKLAYDRPSNKLVGFLAKHFGLRNYVP